MHRANTDASFVDQTVSSLASTAVWLHGAYRFSGGVDGYLGWLDGSDHERGVNLNLGAARQFGSNYEGAVSLRAGSLEYRDEGLRILDTDRYLAGFSRTPLQSRRAWRARRRNAAARHGRRETGGLTVRQRSIWSARSSAA